MINLFWLIGWLYITSFSVSWAIYEEYAPPVSYQILSCVKMFCIDWPRGDFSITWEYDVVNYFFVACFWIFMFFLYGVFSYWCCFYDYWYVDLVISLWLSVCMVLFFHSFCFNFLTLNSRRKSFLIRSFENTRESCVKRVDDS